jgi:proteasome-associated ATPase
MPGPLDREEQELHEKQVHELQTQVKFLEDEVALLRRRLTNAPRQVKILEEKLLETKSDLARALTQNEKVTSALKSERDKIEALREEVEKLSQPPATFGVYLATNEDGSVDVFTAGRKMRVNVTPELDLAGLTRGAEVILNEALNVVEVLHPDVAGEVMKVKDKLGDDRVIVIGHGDEELVATLGHALREEPIRAGDPLLIDRRSNVALERLPKEEVEELVLEEIPDVSYEDIGGLETQIEAIRDAVELPFLYSELFKEHQLEPPKGVLLYGPPGCGKTLIAKAVAKSLADKVRERTGRPDVHSYFLNIKGPELLNKYVGETERQIRQIFQRAKERSEEGLPVIVFFDEMDSIFRTRGSGISSDVESTIVPQLLSELDGVETLKNVIVIGASNREDLIDPAILRPGRLDVKIKIERPSAAQASDIMSKYLTGKVPIHPEEIGRAGGNAGAAVRRMVQVTVDRMYASSDDNRFLEVTYASGDKEVLYFKDFNSGAMIENIVRRSKKEAIKRFLSTGEKHQDRRPAERHPGRVQGERGPPEHHEPR